VSRTGRARLCDRPDRIAGIAVSDRAGGSGHLPSIWRRGFDYLTGDGAMPRSAYRKIRPFGQIPAIEDVNLVRFASGAIVLHIAERFPACCPMTRRVVRRDAVDVRRSRTIEGRVQRLAEIDLLHAEQLWATERRPVIVDAVVELQRGPVQLGLRARHEIGALREVLTEEAIHVLVRPASPARVHRAPGSGRAAAVPLPWRRYVATKVPNRRPPRS
jgi:hypothetical protein